VVPRAVVRLYGQLHDGDVSRREQGAQRNPGAMVEATAGVDAGGDAGVSQLLLDALGQRRVARRRIAQ